MGICGVLGGSPSPLAQCLFSPCVPHRFLRMWVDPPTYGIQRVRKRRIRKGEGYEPRSGLVTAACFPPCIWYSSLTQPICFKPPSSLTSLHPTPVPTQSGLKQIVCGTGSCGAHRGDSENCFGSIFSHAIKNVKYSRVKIEGLVPGDRAEIFLNGLLSWMGCL